MHQLGALRLDFIPDLAAIHQARPEAWPFLLASEAHAGALGRWSLLLYQEGECIETRHPGRADRFLDQLRQRLGPKPRRPAKLPELPFYGGWFVYLGYELVAEVEPKLRLPPARDGLPAAFAARCPGGLIVDHLQQQAWLVGESDQLLKHLSTLVTVHARQQLDPLMPEALSIEADPDERFLSGVERIREWILAGDVFQVNLSRAWRAYSPTPLSAVAVYRALARFNPAPFAGLACLPGGTVISSSPERLVEVRGDDVQTRPIAGTRPRSDCPNADRDLSAELIGNLKERAEHIMLIDLERNDLGRVCRIGSIEVDELMVVESYAHVHHIVSNIRGQLRPGISPVDVIAAVFPGGTITGCPKVRCMEIIAELEEQGRGFYTGSMGYLGLDGSMDLNILIRSMVVAGSQLSFRTGAGIVADSDPVAELAETRAKARGLLKALGTA